MSEPKPLPLGRMIEVRVTADYETGDVDFGGFPMKLYEPTDEELRSAAKRLSDDIDRNILEGAIAVRALYEDGNP